MESLVLSFILLAISLRYLMASMKVNERITMPVTIFFVLIAGYFAVLSAANAEAIYGTSGFAYQKVYSNNDFRENENRVAVNGYLFTDIAGQQINLFGQVATNREMNSPISRLSACLPIKLHDDHESGIRAGKFTRVMGFHNDVSDAPSTARMGMLPQAPYNDLFLTSSFATMDKGAQVYNYWLGEHRSLYTELSVGVVEVGKQDSIQPHLIGTHLSNMELSPSDNNWSLFARYESAVNGYSVIAERSYYELEWSVVGTPDIYSMMVMAGETEPFMFIDRIGVEIRDLPFDTTVSAEKYWLEAYKESGDSSGFYGMVRKSLGVDFDLFAGYSRGTPANNIWTDDRFIGVSKDVDDWFFSLERHDLRGSSWSHKRIADTDSWLVTAAYRF